MGHEPTHAIGRDFPPKAKVDLTGDEGASPLPIEEQHRLIRESEERENALDREAFEKNLAKRKHLIVRTEVDAEGNEINVFKDPKTGEETMQFADPDVGRIQARQDTSRNERRREDAVRAQGYDHFNASSLLPDVSSIDFDQGLTPGPRRLFAQHNSDHNSDHEDTTIEEQSSPA